MIELRKINYDNLKELLELEVNEAQKVCVADNTRSLIDAYISLSSGYHATAYAIYASDIMVGFVMYDYWDSCTWKTIPAKTYYLWRLMIDKRYQGKGYGKLAMEKIIDEIKTLPYGEAECIALSYDISDVGPQGFYKSLGFRETGEVVDENAKKIEMLARLEI